MPFDSYPRFSDCPRTTILFPNDHPSVLEEEKQMANRNKKTREQFDLQWTSAPKQKNPKWLKHHWNTMKKLEAWVGHLVLGRLLSRAVPYSPHSF